MFGICFLTIPGPLSWTATRKRPGWVWSMRTQISGRMPASSQASRELSTASFTVVRRAFRGLSNPSRCRFFAKNSLTETSRCLVAIDSAVARLDLVGGVLIRGNRRRIGAQGWGSLEVFGILKIPGGNDTEMEEIDD